jgi:hypothetical protein
MPKERTHLTSKIKLTLALAGVLAITASIGVATGVIPSTSDGTISACQAKIGGFRYLRPIDKQAGESCKPSEKAINWNQKGPVGPVGARGATGPAGPKGPAGRAGSGLGEIVQQVNSFPIASGKLGQVSSVCKDGKHVLTAGFFADDGVPVLSSTAGPSSDSWTVVAINHTAVSKTLTIQLLCA